MLSINDIVIWANEKLLPLMPGLKTYGIAKSATKGETFMPYVDEKYIGIDDTHPAQLYHKQLTISSTSVPSSGYGDNEQDLQNTYGMAMVVFFDEKKQGFNADSLYTYIQASITGRLKATEAKSIRVSVTSVNLNDPQIWAQEYGTNQYKLFGTQRLIQVNYSVVMVYNKECITIPQCKN